MKQSNVSKDAAIGIIASKFRATPLTVREDAVGSIIKKKTTILFSNSCGMNVSQPSLILMRKTG